MRRWAFGLAPPLVGLTSACLGIVDLRSDPAPTELFVASRVSPAEEDASLVDVEIRARLEPGVTLDGEPRRMLDEHFRVEGAWHAATTEAAAVGPPRLLIVWEAAVAREAPGPEAMRLGPPPMDDFPRPREVNMRVRVDVTPGDSIRVADGEDLVVTVAPLTSPAASISWSLELSSLTQPSFEVGVAGTGPWPSAIRVPAEQMPSEARPYLAELRIRWERSVTLFELTPSERYDVHLQSTQIARWSLVPEGP